MPAAIYRDHLGIPHLRADSVLELAHLQGRECVTARAWQLELLRRRGAGTVSALLGPAGVGWDTLSRRIGIERTARRAFDNLGEEDQAFVSSYAEGVNAGIAAGATSLEFAHVLAGREAGPELWSPWTPLAVFWAQQVLFAHFPYDLRDRFVERHLGPGTARLFRSEHSSGSNCFAVGADRTAAGAPLVAGDPHRGFEAPNVYLQVRLCTPEFDVVGFTFAGVPGIQHFGHAGPVAWGITNAMARYQQLHEVDPHQLSWDHEVIEVAGADPVQVRTADTAHGPVVIDTADEVLSLRCPSLATDDLGFASLLPLLRSRTADEVIAALEGWVEPVNSVIVAETGGRVVHGVAGRVPGLATPQEGYAEWVRLPWNDTPADGAVVTANNRVRPDYAQLGDDFAPPWRAARIRELLDAAWADGIGLDAHSAIEVLLDSRQPVLPLLQAIDAVQVVDSAQDLQRALVEWDREADADSWQAAALEDIRDWVVFLMAGREPWVRLNVPHAYGPVLDGWLHAEDLVSAALPQLFTARHPHTMTTLARALDEVARAPRRRWGSRHRFHAWHELERFGLPVHTTLPEPELAGDSHTVRCTGSLPGTELSSRGSVARYVWDLADRDQSRWSVPLGADGRPGHPHHLDQLSPWVKGETSRIVTDWASLRREDE